LLAQNLLKAADSPETAASGQMYATNPALLQNAMVPKAGQSLTAELQQTLQQLADKIAQGQVSGAQTAALAEQASQALSALKQFAGQKNKGLPSAVNTAATGDSEQTALASRAALVTALAAESADTAATSAPAPVWTLLKGGEHTLPGTGSASAHAQTPQSIPVQQFAQEMGKFMVKQFILSQGNGVSEAKISLQPEHLGQLDIKIVIQNGIMTAKFVAESGAAREMLEAQMAQLRTALQAQGLQVDRMEVVQQQPSQTHASYMGSHHGQQGTGHNGGGARKGNRGGYEDSAAFEAELDRTAFLREIGYGSTLNVTA
jgi:flagellar hook-length control protein FliK